jgi:hypothetical protein
MRYLYIFSGNPGVAMGPGRLALHAGGLQYCMEEVEHLGELEHDPAIQLRKDGVYIGSEEWLEVYTAILSPTLERDGITFDWFKKGWGFGNGITMHKTMASPDIRTVVHGTDLSLDDFLDLNGKTDLADLKLERYHDRHEGWKAYEARWLPGTCPQETHVVHLTWLVTTHALPTFAYVRLWELIELGAELKDRHLYSVEEGKHFSIAREYDGKAAVNV